MVLFATLVKIKFHSKATNPHYHRISVGFLDWAPWQYSFSIIHHIMLSTIRHQVQKHVCVASWCGFSSYSVSLLTPARCRPGVWPVRSGVTRGHWALSVTIHPYSDDSSVTLQCNAGECGLRKRWLVISPSACRVSLGADWFSLALDTGQSGLWTPFSGHVCVPSCLWCTLLATTDMLS